MDNSANNYDLIIFLGEQGEERHEIRKEWYNGELYYSIVDIIAALRVSQKPSRQYWAQLKEQVKDEGFIEAKGKIIQLRLKAADGRFRKLIVRIKKRCSGYFRASVVHVWSQLNNDWRELAVRKLMKLLPITILRLSSSGWCKGTFNVVMRLNGHGQGLRGSCT